MPPRSRRRLSKTKKSRRRKRPLTGGQGKSKSVSSARLHNSRVTTPALGQDTSRSSGRLRNATTAALGAAAAMSYMLYNQRKHAIENSLKNVVHRPTTSNDDKRTVISTADYDAYKSPMPPSSFVSTVTQENYWDKILFLIHLTDLEVVPPAGEQQLRRKTTLPSYLTLVTTDNIDCLHRFQYKPRMLVFSKELLKRKDYIVNTRDIGPSSQRQSEIQITPLLTYFHSQLFELVIAIEQDKQTFLYRSKLAFDKKLCLLLFNEVVFVDPVLWTLNTDLCYLNVIIDDSNLDANDLLTKTGMRVTFPKISFASPTETFVKNLNFLEQLKSIRILVSNKQVNLMLCENKPAGELPIYSYTGRQHKLHMIDMYKSEVLDVEHQLQVACGNYNGGLHNTCNAVSTVLEKYPTNWTDLIRILNEPQESDANKEWVAQDMITAGRQYRKLHFIEFEELEKNMNVDLIMLIGTSWVVKYI